MAKKKKARKKEQRERNTSSLDRHRRVGKTLVPPFLTAPGLTFRSWVNDRLPEMLWACLVVALLPRKHAIAAFREISAIGFKFRDTKKSLEWTLFHSHLPQLPTDILTHIVAVVTRHPLGYAALRPLLLLDGLPGRDHWARALNVDVQEGDWDTLGDAVMKTLDHQSQESTDVRWLSVMFMGALGILHFREDMKDLTEALVEYPHKGDMQSVRPIIRATEMSLAMTQSTDGAWSKEFWKECLDKTKCVPGSLPRSEGIDYDPAGLIKRVREVYESLLEHWYATLETTGLDAKHDCAFGFGFYALSLLLEMLIGRNGQGVTGRALLRTLVECRITLAYLKVNSTADLWTKFRAFGTGQAKLALLKLEEMSEKMPRFVTSNVLQQLSNEDFWQEFVPIELGHWCGVDLRKMAEASGTKDDYDKFYGWPSTFVHGHWSAMRDSCMTICLNPLHRLHRVPLPGHRLLEDAIPDGVALVNSVLNEVSSIYPDFTPRVELKPSGPIS